MPTPWRVLSPALEMKWPGKLNWLFAYQAVVYAVGLLLATGLLSDWGVWYSSSLPYRTQTEALLQGDLAVSRNVADLRFDHTWSEKGVHQVWGLGVPLWRLPFEAAAKLFGFDGFPDRIAFGLFALLVSFVALKVWVGAPASGPAASATGNLGWQLIAGFGAGFIILLLFPPFLTLLQVRGAVWEEAVEYEYLFAVLQLSLLIACVRRPVTWRLYLVCTLAGLGGMIRPTLVFYGFGTVMIAVVAWVVANVGQASSRSGVAGTFFTTKGTKNTKEGKPPSGTASPGRASTTFADARRDRPDAFPALGRILSPALTAMFLFCLGGGLLWLTNLKRFGDGFEFGHRLNVQTLYGSMYATRFDHPFEDEPVAGAARELFGALFLEKKFNGGDWYQERIFPGQSKTVRWREFYFRTYDWSFVPLLLFGWGAAVATGFKFRVSSFKCINPTAADPAPAGGCGFSETASGALAGGPTILTLGLWSLIATLPLAAFYLYTPVISSRYLMDLAPAFAAAIAAVWWLLAARCRHRWSRVLACLLLCGWMGLELGLSRSIYGGPASITAAELNVLRERKPATGGPTANSPAADNYGQKPADGRAGIPFDRAGWNQDTGAVMPLIILFVQDPEFLELEFATQPHPRIVAAPEDIRAKVGLEFLERVKITKTDQGWRVRFRGPQAARWRDGLQVAFVATVPKEFLAERTTPWILKSVRWRATGEDASDHR